MEEIIKYEMMMEVVMTELCDSGNKSSSIIFQKLIPKNYYSQIFLLNVSLSRYPSAVVFCTNPIMLFTVFSSYGLCSRM